MPKIISSGLVREALARTPLGVEEAGYRGVVTLLDQSVVSGTKFLTGVIIGRAVVKEDFGLFVLALSIFIFFTNVQIALITTPYTLLSPQLDKVDRTRYSGSCLVSQIGLSLGSLFLLILASIMAKYSFGNHSFSKVMFVLAFAMPFMLFREYLRRLCFAHLRSTLALALDLLIASIQFSILLFLVYFERITASNGVLTIGAACVLPSATLLVLLKRLFEIQPSGFGEDLRRNWTISRWLLPSGVAQYATVQSYPWFLAGFHGPGPTGVFGACMGPLLLANPFFLGMTNFLAPHMAHELTKTGLSNLRATVYKASIWVTAFTAVLSSVMFLFGGQIVVFLYGAQYGGYDTVIKVLSLHILAMASTIPVQTGLLALKRPDIVFKSQLASLAVALVLGLWLVHSAGVIGAAISMFIGASVASTYRFLSYRTLLRNVAAIDLDPRTRLTD